MVGATRRRIKRGDVYWVNLDPTIGSEIKKTRPALVVSPDDMNQALPRVIVAPLTSRGQPLGCRPEVTFKRRRARILLDQIRCVDKRRLAGKLGKIELSRWHPVLMQMLA
ncbi:MAG: type II toxin-antitoxin system PemK/MazF family toxin [Gammaproteobacteria bacterium]|nr:type II toxin-antitoxin system PemK/MazF family toxin [Gammaproteobacteria bacterium]